MKKVLLICVVIATVLVAVLPSIVYADTSHDQSQCNQGNQGKKYAIVVGISNYPGDLNVLQGGLDLFYADNDAQAVQTALINNGFNPRDISVLVNRQATKDAILDKINDIRNEVRPGDEVVFYFSGHSVIPEVDTPGFPDVVAGLWPASAPSGSDVGMLTWGDNGKTAVLFDTTLQKAFAGFKTSHILFGFDCCWSGRFTEEAGPGRIVVAATGSDPADIAGEYGKAYASLGLGPLPGVGWMNEGLLTYFFVVKELDRGNVSVEQAFNYAQGVIASLTQQFSAFGIDEIPVMIDNSGGNFHL